MEYIYAALLLHKAGKEVNDAHAATERLRSGA